MGFDYSITTGVLAATSVLVAVKLVMFIYNTKKFNRKLKDLPQSPSHPILGHLAEYPGLNDAGLAYERKETERFPRLNLSWLAFMPQVYVNHPDLVKVILKSSEPKSNTFYRFLHPWLGHGLLTSNGNRWSRSRRLLTPAFHFDILKGYISMKNDLCKDLLDKFEQSATSGVSINVFECISMFTLDVILQSTMSYETSCQKEGNKHPYIIAVNRIIASVVNRMWKPWLHWDPIYYLTPSGIQFLLDCRFVHKVADEIIEKRRKELENGVETEKRKRQDFLDTLITARDSDGNGLTSKEIRDEVDTFLFEGHDTTASGLSWCLYSLAEHPEVQRRVQEEVDSILEGRDSDYLLWEDLAKLPYLTMALKEAMRLHNPVPSISRELSKDLELDGYTVPKGTDITVQSYNIHHNPLVWEDSMKYDPDRFLPSNVEKRDPFAFVPFSAGPRNCIGQNFAMDEMKVALARILHKYDISLDPNHKVGKFFTLVMKAENEIKLCVKPRSH